MHEVEGLQTIRTILPRGEYFEYLRNARNSTRDSSPVKFARLHITSFRKKKRKKKRNDVRARTADSVHD